MTGTKRLNMFRRLLLIAVLSSPVLGQPEDNGCKVVNRQAPNPYNIAPATYSPDALNQTFCVRLCGGANFNFAGLEVGNTCLCAVTDTSAAGSDCTVPCAGVPAEMCGGLKSANTFKAAIPIEGLKLELPEGLFEPSADVEVKTTYVKGADLTFTYDFFESVVDKQNFNKKFRIPGEYDVMVTASNPLVNPASAVAGIVIDEKADLAEMHCPIVVPKGIVGDRSEEFQCWARVTRGSRLSATMNWVDSTQSFDIQDPFYSSLGAEPPTDPPKPPDAGSAGTLYIANWDYQTEAGRVPENGSVVIGYEFFATTPGAVKLLVFEPDCPTGQFFCEDTNACSADADCFVGCAAGQKYCPLAAKCVATGDSCGDPEAKTPFNSFKVAHSVDHTAVAGYNWVPRTIDANSDNHTLADGYVVGIHASTGVVGVRGQIGAEATFAYKAVGAPAVGASVDVSTYTTDKVALFRAITSRPAQILFPHNYMSVGDFATTLTIKNRRRSDFAGVAVSRNIAVQLGVDYCIPTNNGQPNKYFKAKTNFDTEIAIQEPSGNGVFYNFTFGAAPMVHGTALVRSHKFTARGVYDIKVSCYNLISLKENTTQVVVEDQIVIESLVCDTPKAVNTAVGCVLTMSSGSAYHCNWTWSDGQAYITEKFMTLEATQSLTHVYQSPPRTGVYDVIVRCSNEVHEAEITTKVFVFEPIENLAFITTGAEVGKRFRVEFGVEKGSGVVYTLTPNIPPFKENGNLLGQSVGQNFRTWRRRQVYSQEFPEQEALQFQWTVEAKNQLNANAPLSQVITFTIDRCIVNATIDHVVTDQLTDPTNPDGISISTGKSIKWTVMAAAGTSVIVTYNPNDGSTPEVQSDTPLAEWNHPTGRTYEHTFTTSGTFDVQVDVRNGCNNFTKNYNVIVYQNPDSITATLHHPTADPTGAGKLELYVSRTDGGGSIGDAQAEWDWGDGQTETTPGFLFDKRYYHTYAAGKYTPKVTISNVLGSKEIAGTEMNLVQGLEDVWIRLIPEHVPVGENVELRITLDAGSDVTVKYDWGSGEQTASAITPPFSQTTTYPAVGENTITVKVSNPVSAHPPLTHVISVQHPALEADFALTTNPANGLVVFPPGTVQFTLAFTGSNLPTDAKYWMDYGDGTAKQEITFTGGSQNIAHTYNTAGCLKASMLIENKCSNVTLEKEVSVATAMTGLAATPKFKPRIPVDADHKPGLGAANNEFSSTLELYLHPDPTGTAMQYEVEIDGSTTTHQCSPGSDPAWNDKDPVPVPISTLAPGDHTITFKANNAAQTASIPIKIVLGISDFQIKPSEAPGLEKTLKVDPLNFNDGTCLHCDFGDGKSVIYGGAKCQASPYKDKYPEATFVGPLSSPFELKHTYASEGAKTMTVTLEDEYDTIKVEQRVTASPPNIECATPNVYIKNGRPSFKNASQCKRGFLCLVHGILEGINCKDTLRNTRTWMIEAIDKNTGVVDSAATAKLKPKVSQLNLKQSSLQIKPRTLPYGFYKLSFDVWMDVKSIPGGFSNISVTYLEIIQSPLVGAQVRGGPSVIKRGVRKHFLLEPGINSYDPDVERDEPQGFTEFIWDCYESGNPAQGEDPPEVLDITKKVSIDAPLDVSEIRANGGCFGTGPGRLIHDGDMVAFHPGVLKPNTTYNSTVTIIKGDRSVTNTLLIQTVDGDPPEVEITFVQEALGAPLQDGRVVSPTYNLLLAAQCVDATCPSVATNRWTVYYNKTHFGWKEVESDEKYLLGVYGFDSEKIELNLPRIVEDYPVVRTTKYLKVKFQTTAPSRPVGQSELFLQLNFPPYGGNCSFTPSEGIADQTRFSIICQDWKDDESEIKNYEVIGKRVGYPDDKVASMTQPSVVTDLVIGSDLDDYKIQLVVRVNDLDGATAFFDMGNVTVRPKAIADFEQEFDAIIANPATSQLSMYEALSDPDETPKKIAAFSSNLNKFSEHQLQDTQTEEYQSSGYEKPSDGGKPVKKRSAGDKQKERSTRGKRTDLRKQGIRALMKMDPADMDQVNGQLSCMSEAIRSTADTSRELQNLVIKKTHALCLITQKFGDEEPEEKLALAETKIEEIVGYYQDSQGLGCDSPGDEDFTDATYLAEYDTDLTSKEPWTPPDPEEGMEIVCGNENRDLQKQSVAEAQKLIDDIEKCIREIDRDHSVPGAKAKVRKTPKRISTAQRDKAKYAIPKELSLGRSKLKSPDACSVVACTEDNPDPIIEARTSVRPNTPWKDRVTEGESTVPAKSDVLTMEIYDESGKEIPIANLDKEFEFEINRESSLVLEGLKTIRHQNITPDWRTTKRINDLESFNLKIEKFNRGNHYMLRFSNYQGQMQLFFKFGWFVINMTEGTYDWTLRIPEYYPDSARPAGYKVPADPDMVMFEPDLVNRIVDEWQGNFTMGVRFLNASLNEFNLYNDSNRPPRDIMKTKWNFDVVWLPDGDGNVPVAFDIVMAATTCNWWDKRNNKWSRAGMTVGTELTTVFKTHCKSNHLTSIGSGWVVTPNKLDFGYILANLDPFKNPTLYITFAIVIALYIILAVLSRRLDLKDVAKCGLTPIMDNDPKDLYLYEMTVATGSRGNAGTKSKIHFILSGEYDETDVRVLNEQPDCEKLLKRGAMDNFLLAVPRPLGPLNYMRVWHDNSGEGKHASWYLRYILLQDVQTKEKFTFIAGRWFAVEEDDGMIDRLLPVAGREQVEEFGHLFTNESRKNMGDGHLWYSVIGRPPRSRFTRLQRVSCCFQILMLSMGASTLFYGQENAAGGWSFGPFTLTPRQITIAVFTNLIIFPPTFLTVWLFRKTRPRKLRTNRYRDALEKSQKMRTASVSDVRAEIHSDTSPLNQNEITNHDTTPPGTADNTPRPIHVEGQETINLETGDEDLRKKKKKKKKIVLPWYFLIVSWVILWLTLLTGAFLLFSYGVMFGDEKIRKWLTSFIISVIMSAFITQPIKVFLLALFFSLILKKTSDEEEEEEGELDEEPYLRHNEEWMYNQSETDSLSPARPRTIAYKPPDPKRLETLRQNRVKEVKMYAILSEIFSFLVFISVLLLVSYGFRDPAAYQLQVHLQRMMVNQPGTDVDFNAISNYDQFWAWLENVYIPATRADLWYTNDLNSPDCVNVNLRQPFGQRGFKDDRTSRMMGWAIMRQLRIPGNTCRGRVDPDMRNLTHECNDVYNMASEETDCFDPGWRRHGKECPSNISTSEVGYNWRYHTGAELEGFPWIGQLTMYSGGGYPFLFQGTEDNMKKDLQHLKDNLWLDELTRAVFVEWALFNPNSGLFSVNTMLVEFPRTTGAIPTFRFEPMDLLGTFEPGALLIQYAAQALFVIFLLYYLIHEIREMFKLKGEYWKEIWNYNELAIIFLSFFGIGIYVYRWILMNDLVARFMASRGLVYIKFQIVAQWHEIMMYLVGLVVFFSNLKFIRLLRFNRRMSLLGSTLRQSGPDLVNFGIMFGVIFFSYVQLFYLLFLRYLIGYKTVVASASTNMNIMLGKFNFQDMMNASPMLAPLFFFLYVLTMVMIVMNMFISILCETFTQVRSDLMKQGNDFEMVDFMLGRFKNFVGIGKRPPEDLNNSKPVDGVSAPFEVQIDNFPHKIDKLLNSINKVYFDNDNFDLLLDPSKLGSNKELYKNLLKNNQVSNKNILPDIEENDDTSLKKGV